MSPTRMPATAPDSSKSGAAAEKPASTSTPRPSATWARCGVSCPSERMKLPWLLSGGGTGSRSDPVGVSSRISSRVAGTHMAGRLSRQPGSSSSSGPGSITAPDKAWLPTAAAFSSTHTERAASSCLRRMAQASPAGPAPTITTSYSMTSLSGRVSGDGLLLAGTGASPRFGWSAILASQEKPPLPGRRQ